MPVVTLSQVDRLRLVLVIPESAVSQVRAGLPIQIHVAVNRDFVGRVSRNSDRLQTSTRTMETEVDVANTTGDLAPGMYAEARLSLDRRAGVLSLPVQAVTGAEDKASLLVVEAQGRLAER